MKISRQGMITFDEVHDGQCFECSGLIFIKTYSCIIDCVDQRRLATNLFSGSLTGSWTGSEECTLYENAEVILK